MIEYIDRKSGQRQVEKVYGQKALSFLYGDYFFSKPLLHLLSRIPFFSAFVGFWQSRSFTKRKIAPFIQEHGVDPSEFAKPIEKFSSFNDFFIRKLNPNSRPIAETEAIIPADGRYWFYEKISSAFYFNIKGEKFDLSELLEDSSLAKHYEEGSLVIARLCPSDYHRFHFPCDGVPQETKLINGWLYSVNPIAIKRDVHIFTKNKRTLCLFKSAAFGELLILEIGATSVGTIHQTYEPNRLYKKGAEKGFFSFGGSSLVLLFQPGKIQFDKDLLDATKKGYEIRCLMGQSMGSSLLP